MNLELAGALIRAGKLVAFPTETVYGLGANALDERAVAAIFRAKGRPATSPLIVHVCSLEMARGLARRWPESAQQLAERFWPGPLTLVVPKETRIPPLVTANLDTVGLRMPAHPLALELIRRAGVPVAAPSANRFSELSPTTAEHVRRSLGESVDLILDGGPTTVGLESTVLSLAGDPELLRPGMVSREEIEAVIGKVRLGGHAGEGPHRSPGLHRKHYSPATPLLLVREGRLPASGRGAYVWIATPAAGARSVPMPPDSRNYARALYDTLHRLDREGFDWIAVEAPPEEPEWAAVNDRLRRASHA
ncbi:MAG: threonylcarbamoyl-AMP synthase [Bryobacterales bacterium]|nr:threonylcarbamoyl-AMP synthase [Bryobacterales bacterium]